MWRSEYSLKVKSALSETVSADGTVRVVGRGKAVPWPDGSRFATTEWDTSKTVVRIVDTASGEPLHSVEFKGLVRDLKPSPMKPSVVALRQGESTVGKSTWVIADFSQRSFLDRFPADSAAFAWLPDGGFVIVSKAGELKRGRVGKGARSELITRLNLPAGRTVANAWLDPRGTRLLLRLDLRPPTKKNESDLWITDLKGSLLERFTASGMTTLAAWSPDGKQVAFDVDTGAWCSGHACQGICEVWRVDSDAREVRGSRNEKGRSRRGCTLLGWTR